MFQSTSFFVVNSHLDNVSTSSEIRERGNVASGNSLTGKVNAIFGENQKLQEENQQSLVRSQSVGNKRKRSSISGSASSPLLDSNLTGVIEEMERGERLVDHLSFILRLPSERITSLKLDGLVLDLCSRSEMAVQILKAIPDLLFQIRFESLSPEERRGKEQFVQQCLTKIAINCRILYLGLLCEILLMVYPTLAFSGNADLYKLFMRWGHFPALDRLIQSDQWACFTIVCYLLFREGRYDLSHIKKESFSKLSGSDYRDFIFIMNTMGSKNPDQAIHQLEQVEGRYQALAWALKGEFLIEKRQFQEAIHCLTLVLTPHPYEVLALTFRGEAYREIGAVDLAIEDLNLVLEIDPNQKRARCQRGICWYQKRKMREAYEDFQKLVNRPEDLQAILRAHSVDILYEDCGYHITEDKLFFSLFIHPNKVWTDRRNQYSRLPQGWMKRWDDLFQNNFRNASYLGRKGAGFLLEENFDRAYNYLTEALRVDPNDIFSLSRKGLCLILRGQGEEALSDFERVFAIDSKHLFSLCIRGQYFSIQGEESRALEDFNAVLGQDANHRLALLKRAEILFAQNKSDLALADLDKILKVDPSFILALALQARIFYARGEFQQAKEKSNAYLCYQVSDSGQLSYACIEEMLWIWRQSAFHQGQFKKLDRLLQYLENMIESNRHMQEPYFLEKKIGILLELNRMDELDQMMNWNRVHQLGDYFQYLKLKKIWNKQGAKEEILKIIDDYYKKYSLPTSQFHHFIYGPYSNRAFFLKLKGDYWYNNGQFDQAKKDYLSFLQFSPSCDKNNEMILEIRERTKRFYYWLGS